MIRQKYLLALEEEDWAALPSSTYVKGFIRSYANYLELSPEDLISLYQLERSGDDRQVGARPIASISGSSTKLRLSTLLAFSATVAAAVFAFYLYRQYQSYVRAAGPVPVATSTAPIAANLPTAVVPPTPTPIPAPTATPSPTPRPGPGIEITVSALKTAWMRVQVDGKEVFQGTLRDGSVRTFKAQDVVFILCGNAGGVSISRDGRTLGLMGAEGQVVEREWRASR